MKLKDSPIQLLILDVDGTLTDGSIFLSDDGQEIKRFNAKDGMGIRLLTDLGFPVGIISHSLNVSIIKKRAKMLGMPYFYAGKESKEKVLSEWVKELNINNINVAFIGDDYNDLSIMKIVGHAACPSDAHECVKDICNTILSKKGGDGAVREFIDNHLLDYNS